MDTTVLSVRTGTSPTVVDLTSAAGEFCQGRGDGLLSVFVPHATAGVAILETGAGSDAALGTGAASASALLTARGAPLPRDGRWRHRHGAPGHGADHVLPAFIAPSITIPVIAGSLALGTWQSVVLVDTNVDNPDRSVRL